MHEKDSAWRRLVLSRLEALELLEERSAAGAADSVDELAALLHDFADEAGLDPDSLEVQKWLEHQIPDAESLAESLAGRGARPVLGARSVVEPTSRFRRVAAGWGADLTFAFRSLSARPGFSLTTILVLSLGIGFNAAVFTVVDNFVFEPLPVHEPERLVSLYSTFEGSDLVYQPVTGPDLRDLKASMTGFEDVTAYAGVAIGLGEGADAALEVAEAVQGNYFTLLGVEALLGRVLDPEDDHAGAQSAIVLSHRLWTSRFGSDPEVLGRDVRVNGRLFTVVGVMPSSFTGMMRVLSPAAWIPLESTRTLRVGATVSAGDRTAGVHELDDRGWRWLWPVGRLATGASLPSVREELEALGVSLGERHPEASAREFLALPSSSVRLLPDMDGVLVNVSRGLLILVALLLVIACSNVANMAMARSLSRRREIATRLALGARRWTIVRQLLTESLVLGCLGGLGGVLVAQGAARGFAALPIAAPLPITMETIGVDLRALLYVGLLVVGAAVLFGTAPALCSARTDLVLALRERAVTSSRSRRLVSRTLVAAQIALSSVLLIAAGSSVRGLQLAQSVDLGFETDGRLVVTTSLASQGWEGEQVRAFYESWSARVAQLPQVVSSGRIDRLPLSFEYSTETVATRESASRPREEWLQAEASSIDSGYLETVGMPVLHGRGIRVTDRSDAPSVVLINRELAQRLTGGDPGLAIGLEVTVDGEVWSEVVGVVPDTRIRDVRESPRAAIYYSIAQQVQMGQTLVVEIEGDADTVLPAIRRAALELAPAAAFLRAMPFDESVSASLDWSVTTSILLMALGGLGLTLASVGLYGVLAWTVHQRSHEIGIRMALGADRGRVVRLVLGDGARLAVLGLMVGAGTAWLGRGALTAMLVGAATGDRWAWCGSLASVAFVAMVAVTLPGIRASSVDPIGVLRDG